MNNYIEAYKSCSLFGTLRYFVNIKDSVFLIHGPSGCAYFNRSAVLNLNGFSDAKYIVETPKIFCTDFNEKDAVFGAKDKLKVAAFEIIKRFSPKLLVIFNCCVSEVIGDDIDDVCCELEGMYSIPILAVHSGGFKGDHKYGMRLAGELILNRLVSKPDFIERKKVNIIGDFDYFQRGAENISKFLNLIGISDITIFPGQCSIEEIYGLSSASLNIIFCQNASRHMAEIMKKEFGTPYIGAGGDFFGLEQTKSLYCEICNFFGKNQEIVLDKYNEVLNVIQKLKNELAGTTAVVVAGMHRASGYSQMLKELGVKVLYIFSECDTEYFDNSFFSKYSKNFTCNESSDDLYRLIKSLNPDFILSTLPDIIAPAQYLHQGMMDFTGFTGFINFAKYLVDAKNLGYEAAYNLLRGRLK